MLLETRSAPLFVTNSSNDSTAGTSIANPADTQAVQSPGTGLINLGDTGGVAKGPGAMSPNGLLLIPFGVGTSGNTFLLSVFAVDWIKGVAAGNFDTLTYWPLATFTCTLCTLAGIANSEVNASQLYCGTITLNVGNANISNEIISPTGNVKASIILDVKGVSMVQLKFAMNGSATSANCLARRL